MTIIELKTWFFDKLNSCYPVIHDDYPNNIFWYYDNNFVRKKKLSNLIDEKIKLPKKISGTCFFLQVIDHKTLWCDYDNIWLIFYDEYIDYYGSVQLLINNWLLDFPKMKGYISQGTDFNIQLEDYLKMKIKYF